MLETLPRLVCLHCAATQVGAQAGRGAAMGSYRPCWALARLADPFGGGVGQSIRHGRTHLRTLAMAVVAMALLGRLHQADVIDGGACFW